MLCLAVVACALIILQPFPVLHDYPEWMYQGYITFSLINGVGNFHSLFELVSLPVPNAISQIAIATLNLVTTPVMAGKIWLAFYLVLAAVVGLTAMRSQPDYGVLRLLFIVTIVFGPGFWNGYINFQFGLLFFALFVVTNARQSALWIVVFSLLLYFSHASVYAAFVCFVLATGLITNHKTKDHRKSHPLVLFCALLPSLLLLSWYTVSRLSDGGGNERLGSWLQWVQYKIYTLAKQGPFHNFILADGESLLESLHGLYLAGFAVNFLCVVLIGLWMLTIVWDLCRRKFLETNTAPEATACVITVAVLIFAWLLAGKNSFGVVNLGERFLIVGLMLMILKMRCPRWISTAWATLCVAMVFVLIGSLLVLSQQVDQHGRIKTYTVDRSADAAELTNYVDDIYRNSRHKYFNHRLFIYASLGEYLMDPTQFDTPPPIDHQSSIVRMRTGVAR